MYGLFGIGTFRVKILSELRWKVKRVCVCVFACFHFYSHTYDSFIIEAGKALHPVSDLCPVT